MFRLFENLFHPYPDAQPATPPKSFFAFMWACTSGMRRYTFAMTSLTSLIGVFEAMLLSMLGNVVDCLAQPAP